MNERKIYNLSKLLLCFLIFFTFCAQTAFAADKRELIGSYRNWDAFKITHDDGSKTCYMISTPLSSKPANANRGDIYTMITMRPRLRIENQVNIVVGYPFKDGSNASATIDNKQFRMFTEGDGAWLSTPEDDNDMVEAMRGGNSMVAKGTSSRGTNTSDHYSLSGFTAAHNAIKQACKN